MASLPQDWEEARLQLNLSAEKIMELEQQGVLVKDLFFMSPDDLREHGLSTITRSRIAQLKPSCSVEPSASATSGEKEFSTGLAGVKGFSGEPEAYEDFIFQLESL